MARGPEKTVRELQMEIDINKRRIEEMKERERRKKLEEELKELKKRKKEK